MNMLHRTFVVENAGLEDHWAERLVDRMIEPLRDLQQNTNAELESFLKKTGGASVGSAKGFAKWTARISRRTGDTILATVVQPRSRMRSAYIEDRWLPHPNATSVLCQRLVLFGMGPNRNPYADEITFCSITRHALTRLVQRAGCTSPSELHGAIRAAWPTVSTITTASLTADVQNACGGWAAPFRFKGRDLAAIVVRNDSNDGVAFDVVTVLELASMDTDVRQPLLDFMADVDSAEDKIFSMQMGSPDCMRLVAGLLPSLEIAHPFKFAKAA